MLEGKVKWFNNEKGFGFIYTNSLDDHFFNVKDVNGFDLPNVGDIVEFESNSGKKGLSASKVKIIKTKKNEGKTTCPSCNAKVTPKVINNPRRQWEIIDDDGNSLGSADMWSNAYISGNCPLCGYEIWSND